MEVWKPLVPLVDVLALPPISTYFDLGSGTSLYGTGPAFLYFTGAVLVIRAIVTALLTGLILEALERLQYRERLAARRALTTFAEEAAGHRDPQTLLARLGKLLQEALAVDRVEQLLVPVAPAVQIRNEEADGHDSAPARGRGWIAKPRAPRRRRSSGTSPAPTS